MLKNYSLQLLSFCLLTLCLTSCGWHLSNEYRQKSDQESNRPTITIPYVSGDHDGTMTTSLVAAIVKQGTFTYLQDGGTFTLQVALVDSKSENIGFRYDPEKLSNGKHKTIPSETRRKLLAKVTVVNNSTNEVVFGPSYILGTTDFDHQYYNVNHNTNTFSLGQLTDVDTTYDVVDTPLYRTLSQNIATFLANNSDLIKR